MCRGTRIHCNEALSSEDLSFGAAFCPTSRQGLRDQIPSNLRQWFRSGLQHLVALLPSLQTLHTPLVHLLLHLLEPFALFLGCPFGFDRIDSALDDS
jgi:hypothetical protein